MQVDVRRVLVRETGISVAINASIPPGIIWALGVAPPRAIVGPHGLLSGLAAATALPIFFMTILLGLSLRARMGAGRVAKVGMRALTLRAIKFTLVGLAVLLPCAVLTAVLARLVPMNLFGFGVFNVVYGAIVGLAVTPFVVLAVLAEFEPERNALRD